MAITKRASAPSPGCAAAPRWAARVYPAGKICTTVPSFVDTNILIYAEDRDGGKKHSIARDLVLDLWESKTGVLSVQVLQEFYVNITRKAKKPLAPAKARELVEEYLTWTVVENTKSLLRSALKLHHDTQLSFWDAMVVQAALASDCDRLYTEDLSAGQRFDSLTLVNPFK